MQCDSQITVRVPREIYDSITEESVRASERRSTTVRRILINHYRKNLE